MIYLYILFYFGQLSHLFLCFGATNLNEPPSSFCSLLITAG